MLAEVLFEARNALGEAPLWDERRGVLYWVDCLARELLRAAPSGPEIERWPLPGLPGCIVARRQGGLLIGYRNGLGRFDPDTGEPTALGVNGIDFARERLNDGKCDPEGRFWVGTMDRELRRPVAAVYCLQPGQQGDGLALERSAIDGLTLSNGLAWSPDGSSMYVCDSRPGAVLRYDYDMQTGTPAGRQLLVDYAGSLARPDGCAMDAEGGLWVAEFGAGRVSRYDARGRLDARVELPVSRPTSVTFGGDSMQTLFITSMREGTDVLREPLAGCVFAARPGVRGLPVGRCAD